MQAGSNAGQYNNGIMSENLDHIYKLLFHKYYANLLFYATRIVGEEEAEDVVQDVFVELWVLRHFWGSSCVKASKFIA